MGKNTRKQSVLLEGDILPKDCRETKWMNIDSVAEERISKHYTTAQDTDIEIRKVSITPPASKKSVLDRAPNRVSRTIAQIRAGHWLCAPYLMIDRLIYSGLTSIIPKGYVDNNNNILTDKIY
jgi:hypothetical protein